MSVEFPVAQPVEAAQSDLEQAHEFFASQGLEHLAYDVVEAHGRRQSFAQAFVECQPFANMVRGMAENLPDMPNRTDILEKTIRSASASAPAEEPAEAKKKLN